LQHSQYPVGLRLDAFVDVIKREFAAVDLPGVLTWPLKIDILFLTLLLLRLFEQLRRTLDFTDGSIGSLEDAGDLKTFLGCEII